MSQIVKMTQIISCSKCNQKLRIPTDFENLEIICPACKTKQEFSHIMNEREKLNDSIRKKIHELRTYTPKVGVFGNSGVGKSSLCNALFGRDVAKISDVEACTRKPQEILLGTQNGGMILVDVPGIGEDPTRQEEYTKLYQELAPNLDLILWAIKADDRNYASAMDTYKVVFANNLNAPPVIFVITQTDKTNDTADWNHQTYEPGESQKANIAIKENDVSKRFNIPTSQIISVAYSQKTGKTYNLKELIDLIVEVLPKEKKYAFTREANKENVTEEARIEAEKGIWDTIKDFAGKSWDSIKEQAFQYIRESGPAMVEKLIKEHGKEILEKGWKWAGENAPKWAGKVVGKFFK